MTRWFDDPILSGVKREGIVIALAWATPDVSKSLVNALWNQPQSRQSVRGLFGSMGTTEERNYDV
jgi:hypothetical protein